MYTLTEFHERSSFDLLLPPTRFVFGVARSRGRSIAASRRSRSGTGLRLPTALGMEDLARTAPVAITTPEIQLS
jgi:hypothetical protein